MKLIESNFGAIVRYGGIVLVISVVASVYLVMRHYELSRSVRETNQKLQEVSLNQQSLQSLFREFGARAGNDQNIAQILIRNGLMSPRQRPAAPPAEVKTN